MAAVFPKKAPTSAEIIFWEVITRPLSGRRESCREIIKNRYVIIKRIGKGIYAGVWLAKDCKFGVYVAIKIYKSAPYYRDIAAYECENLLTLNKFQKENKAECAVKLFNTFVHKGSNGNHCCLVLELLGPDLEEIIQLRPGLLTPNTIKLLTKKLLYPLREMHTAKVIHTDIKARNYRLCIPPLLMVD